MKNWFMKIVGSDAVKNAVIALGKAIITAVLAAAGTVSIVGCCVQTQSTPVTVQP